MTAAVSISHPLPYDRVGSGPPLLLLHGAMVDRGYWQERIPVLAAHHEVIACDLPGHGSAAPIAEPTSIAELAAAVLATLDALGLPTVTILGHSLGGMVAQELALAAPERVSALVLADTWCRPRGYFGEPFPFRTVYLHWSLRTFPVAQMIELMAVGVATRTPAILPYARRAMGRYLDERDSLLYIWDAATDFDSHERLGRIGCPTLILASDGHLFTVVQSQRLAAGIPGASLVVLPNTGHWVSWDNPAAFDAAVLAFLAALAPGS